MNPADAAAADESWTSVDAVESGRWSPQPAADAATWPAPDERAVLAAIYGPCAVMHNQFRCMHGGHAPAGASAEWIANAVVAFCVRRHCPLAQSAQPLAPVLVDRATLPGFALLVCPRCDEAGRQAHSTRARTAAIERPPCKAPGCGGLAYVRVVTADADVNAWMSAGRQRQQARLAAQSRAVVQATTPARSAAPTLADVFDAAHLDGPTMLGHWLFECGHGGKGGGKKAEAATKSSWIDNAPRSTCRTCQRAVAAVATDRTQLSGFALLSCRTCLDDGCQPNTVRMHIKSTDVLRCRRDGSQLRIRAIVAAADIERWLGAGIEWLAERGAAEMAANVARAADHEAFHASIVRQCTQEPQSLAAIYATVHSASRLVSADTIAAVAAHWLGAQYPAWTKRHADAPARLAAIVCQAAPMMAHKCDFCGANALTAAGIQMAPRFCDDIRCHLRLPDAPRRLTIGCIRGGCAGDASRQNCHACVAAPSSNHMRVLARQRDEQQRGLAEQLCTGSPLKAGTGS